MATPPQLRVIKINPDAHSCIFSEMWQTMAIWLSLFLTMFVKSVFSDTSSPYLYCADMNPQQHVNIEQLMGMWYGIEILTHHTEEHYVRIGTSCPILHISEDKEYLGTTINPLYKNYNYGYNYGERRPPIDRPTDRTTYEQQRYHKQQYPQNRNYNNRRFNSRYQNNGEYFFDMKRIKIWWDENGSATEYHLKYNTSRPGFWISSGPHNGSELNPLYSDFAGTVQVIKAVGNHMVLTFCHRLPERQLLTILLSRENRLSQADIHSVHNLLNRRGLSTNAVKKVCWNGSDSVKISLGTVLVSVLVIFGFSSAIQGFS